MSVIAYDGTTIAADRQMTNSGMRAQCEKLVEVFRGDDRFIFGWTGFQEGGLLLMAWYLAGADKDKWPEFQKTDDWTRLIVVADKTVVTYERQPIALPVLDPYMAGGLPVTLPWARWMLALQLCKRSWRRPDGPRIADSA